MAEELFSRQGGIELQEDVHEIHLHSAETHELDISQEDAQKCLDYERKLQELYLKKPKLGKDAHVKDYIELWSSTKYKEWDKAYHDLRDEYEAFFARITGKEKDKPLPMPKSVIPQKYAAPTSKLANLLPSGIVNSGEREIRVSKNGAKNPVYIVCDIAYRGKDISITGRNAFDYFDRNVLNAITTLCVYGNGLEGFTIPMVYRAMNSMKETEYVSPKALEEVKASIEKMRFTEVSINCDDQARLYGLEIDGNPVIRALKSTYMLKADRTEFEIKYSNGTTAVVKGYVPSELPAIYEHARLFGQVQSVPAALLSIKEVRQGQITDCSIPTNRRRTNIRGELLARVTGMKGNNKLKNNRIALQSYDRDGAHHPGLYEIAGLPEDATGKERKAVRDYAESVLQYWQATGFIKEYSFAKIGKTVSHIEIEL